MAKLLRTVQAALSVERLDPYRREVDGDLSAAIRLYEWNTVMSAALWADITDLEVLVRNTMHDQLTEWSTRRYSEPRWYLDPGRILTPRHTADVTAARVRIAHSDPPKEETPGRIVSELSFGFWRYLVARHYDDTLWRDCLRHSFPGQPVRNPLHGRLSRLHKVRNRIAHHQGVYREALSQVHKDLLTVIEWINPTLRQWVQRRSTVQAILAQRPRG
jgi:Abi-like protein